MFVWFNSRWQAHRHSTGLCLSGSHLLYDLEKRLRALALYGVCVHAGPVELSCFPLQRVWRIQPFRHLWVGQRHWGGQMWEWLEDNRLLIHVLQNKYSLTVVLIWTQYHKVTTCAFYVPLQVNWNECNCPWTIIEVYFYNEYKKSWPTL